MPFGGEGITFCDSRILVSLSESWNMKSIGNLTLFRLTLSFAVLRANLLNRERNDAYTPTIVIPHFGNTPSGANRIPSREEIRTAVTGKERVWLVLNTGSISLVPSRKEAVPIIRKTLEEQFEVRVEQTLSGTPSFFIALYERKRSSNHF